MYQVNILVAPYSLSISKTIFNSKVSLYCTGPKKWIFALYGWSYKVRLNGNRSNQLNFNAFVFSFLVFFW
jgi:hypothetical protein